MAVAEGVVWYREPWPWILMSGPAAVVVAGIITAYIAVANDDPLVVDNYYREGLAINRTLARDEAALAGGYRAQVMFSEDGSRVRVHLAGVILPSGIRLRAAHPTNAALDRTVELPALHTGWYEGEIRLAGAVRWRLELEDAARAWRLIGEWRPARGGAVVLGTGRG